MAKDEQRSKILTVSVALREQIYRNAINEIQSYPAPPQLATKTELSSQEVKAITEAVNPLIAVYLKTKNFHWHLYGSHFRDLHEHADAIFESIDTMAERVRRVGGTTIRSISHIAQLQTITAKSYLQER
jgi:starvation-inducible DNA-binding protein